MGFCCTCVFGVADNDEMRKQGTGRNPLFKKRWFSDAVIILCVRWYLRFRLSYRDLASIAAEMGVSVAPCTILAGSCGTPATSFAGGLRSSWSLAGRGALTRHI